MYNSTHFGFLMFLAAEPPLERCRNVFFFHNYNVFELTLTPYEYAKEPPIEGFNIIVSVY